MFLFLENKLNCLLYVALPYLLLILCYFLLGSDDVRAEYPVKWGKVVEGEEKHLTEQEKRFFAIKLTQASLQHPVSFIFPFFSTFSSAYFFYIL